MREISIKEPDVGDELKADAFNAQNKELENAVTDADITLDPDGGPDTDLEMLSKSVSAYSAAGKFYTDVGSADAYILNNSTNLQQVSQYYDGLTAFFKADNTSTSDCTIRIGSLDIKDIVLKDGSILSTKPGIIKNDEYSIITYDEDNDNFVLLEYSPLFASTAEIKAATEDEKFISPKKYSEVDLEFHPIGLIQRAIRDNIPFGYLACNESEINRTTYSDLFSLIGTTFGVGNGSTTFNLPLTDFSNIVQGSDSATRIEIDLQTGDIYIVLSTGRIKKQTGGSGAFNLLPVITGPINTHDISIDKSTGDLYSIDITDTDIYVLPSGTSTWIVHPTPPPGSNHVAIDVNPNNGDIYITDGSSSKMYKQTGGSGSWADLSAPVRIWIDASIDSDNGELFLLTTSELWKYTGSFWTILPLPTLKSGETLQTIWVNENENRLLAASNSGTTSGSIYKWTNTTLWLPIMFNKQNSFLTGAVEDDEEVYMWTSSTNTSNSVFRDIIALIGIIKYK